MGVGDDLKEQKKKFACLDVVSDESTIYVLGTNPSLDHLLHMTFAVCNEYSSYKNVVKDGKIA